jgi:hypothetical protein
VRRGAAPLWGFKGAGVNCCFVVGGPVALPPHTNDAEQESPYDRAKYVLRPFRDSLVLRLVPSTTCWAKFFDGPPGLN